MTSASADKKSVILPLPSSPHWVPTTTTDIHIFDSVRPIAETKPCSFFLKNYWQESHLQVYLTLYYSKNRKLFPENNKIWAISITSSPFIFKLIQIPNIF